MYKISAARARNLDYAGRMRHAGRVFETPDLKVKGIRFKIDIS